MLEGINYLHAKFQINILKSKKSSGLKRRVVPANGVVLAQDYTVREKKGEILSKHALENILYYGPSPEKSINVCVFLKIFAGMM